jgi:cell division septation protein DedD
MRPRLSFGEAAHVYVLVLAFAAVLYLIGLFVGKSYQGRMLTDAEIAEATMEPVEDLSTQMEFYDQLSDGPTVSAPENQPSAGEHLEAVAEEAREEETAVAPAGIMYTIQLGAHSTEEEARQLLMKLEAKNFSGKLRVPSGNEQPRYFRVWVGEFSSMEAAQPVEAQLKEAGFYTYIRRVE